MQLLAEIELKSLLVFYSLYLKSTRSKSLPPLRRFDIYPASLHLFYTYILIIHNI